MPSTKSTITPFTGRGMLAAILGLEMDNGEDEIVLAALMCCDGDLVETHPIVEPGSLGTPSPPPIVTSTPEASGTILYHCGRVKSTTTRVTGGCVEYKLARTLRTAPRFTFNRLRPAPGRAFGRSITSRSGCSIICACGTV